jgi:hypothetical protein
LTRVRVQACQCGREPRGRLIHTRLHMEWLDGWCQSPSDLGKLAVDSYRARFRGSNVRFEETQSLRRTRWSGPLPMSRLTETRYSWPQQRGLGIDNHVRAMPASAGDWRYQKPAASRFLSVFSARMVSGGVPDTRVERHAYSRVLPSGCDGSARPTRLSHAEDACQSSLWDPFGVGGSPLTAADQVTGNPRRPILRHGVSALAEGSGSSEGRRS